MREFSFTSSVAYKIFDMDGKGYITKQELSTIFKLVFEILEFMGISGFNTAQCVDVLISAFDKSKQGAITQHDFYQFASTRSQLVKGII